MDDPKSDGQHPGRLELTQYARGRLERGHAVAILAHAAACARCAPLVAALAAAALGVPPRPAERVEDRGLGEPIA